MNTQNNLLYTFLLIFFSTFLLPNTINAHPGRTASDGCHYCRTNCDYWGEAWNVRHCHNGSTNLVPEPALEPEPTPTPQPAPEPMLIPASVSEIPAAKDPIYSRAMPETSDDAANLQPDDSTSNTAVLVTFAVLGGLGYGTYRGVKAIVRKIKK